MSQSTDKNSVVVKAGPYVKPIGCGEYDLAVKKSRFLVRYQEVQSREQALEWIEQWRKHYPDARHHCWAYVIGSPVNPDTVAMSDDGEPSGTAGKPILSAIQGKGVGDICVVVVRYFGGTKLGAGGLIRAYCGSVSKALDSAETRIIKPTLDFEIECSFALEQKLRHWVAKHNGEILNVEYGANVLCSVRMDVDIKAEFEAFTTAHGMRVQ